MRYSVEPRDRVYVKGYGFSSLAKNLNNKYSQKLIDPAKRSTTNALKTALKRAMEKIAEATGDLIGNKTADKITNISKKFAKELHNNDETEDVELTTNKKKIHITKRKTTNY